MGRDCSVRCGDIKLRQEHSDCLERCPGRETLALLSSTSLCSTLHLCTVAGWPHTNQLAAAGVRHFVSAPFWK